MKIIFATAAMLGFVLTGAAYGQTNASSTPTPEATAPDATAPANDRGITIDSSGAAVPAPVPGASTEPPPGSYPATSDVAPTRDVSTPERSTARPPAVSNPRNTLKTSAAPVPGKNSFSAAQARKRFEANGYAQISGLQKDKDSIWRAQAMKNGRQTRVALDYQGNIVEAP